MSGDVLPCLADPLATAGFGTLQRMRPVKARAMLLEVLPVPVDLTTGPTVEATLRGGHRQRALLERRAALTELKRRCRTKKRMGLKYLHLLDSAVAIGVLAKKRSSSHRLQRVVRRFDALETASGCVPIFSFCRSNHNPTDYPSRVRKKIRTQKDGRQS